MRSRGGYGTESEGGVGPPDLSGGEPVVTPDLSGEEPVVTPDQDTDRTWYAAPVHEAAASSRALSASHRS